MRVTPAPSLSLFALTVALAGSAVFTAAPVAAQNVDDAIAFYLESMKQSAPPEATVEWGSISNGTVSGLNISAPEQFTLTADTAAFTDVQTGDGNVIESVGTLDMNGVNISFQESATNYGTISADQLVLSDLALGQFITTTNGVLGPNPDLQEQALMESFGEYLGGVRTSNLRMDIADEYEPFELSVASAEVTAEGSRLSNRVESIQFTGMDQGKPVNVSADLFSIQSIDISSFEAMGVGRGMEVGELPTGAEIRNLQVTGGEGPDRFAFVLGDMTMDRTGNQDTGAIKASLTNTSIQFDASTIPPEQQATMQPFMDKMVQNGNVVIPIRANYDSTWDAGARQVSLNDFSLTFESLLEFAISMQMGNIDPAAMYSPEGASPDVALLSARLHLNDLGITEMLKSSPEFMMMTAMGAGMVGQFATTATDPAVQQMAQTLTAFLQDPRNLTVTVQGGPDATMARLAELTEGAATPDQAVANLEQVLDISITANQ